MLGIMTNVVQRLNRFNIKTGIRWNIKAIACHVPGPQRLIFLAHLAESAGDVHYFGHASVKCQRRRQDYTQGFFMPFSRMMVWEIHLPSK